MIKKFPILLLSLIMAFTVGCSNITDTQPAKTPVKEENKTYEDTQQKNNEEKQIYDFSTVPDYSDVNEYVIQLNDNVPDFNDEQKQETSSKIQLSDLDSFGRCGQAYEVIGKDILPSEERKDIASIYPTGWHQEKYGGTYVYNRSHLLAFCLSGLNDEKRNLITGTEYMNQDVMADYEVKIRDYVKNSGNHVVYRVTPDFRNDELVARGVQIEAYSVEDSGEGISMNIYLYNVQPGVVIDYETGYTSSSDYVQGNKNNSLTNSISYKINTDEQMTFVVNSSNGKFHTADCYNAKRISSKNRQEMVSTVNQMLENGYDPSGCCIKK